MPRFQPTQARGENHPPVPVGVCKNEGESRGKEGKEAQGGGWVGGVDSTLPFAGSLTDIPLPPPSAPHWEGREDGGIVFLHAPLPWLRSDNRLGLLQRTPGHWVGVRGRGSAEQPLSN